MKLPEFPFLQEKTDAVAALERNHRIRLVEVRITQSSR